ncbi:hypothetical protein GCM10007875_17020 [Limnobacter litoralis]|uniref:Secreted protein n=2 Tax=Limnobacter litoralis TaxID=481366 RepID=A0ABQ5YVV5_9BURK|nr:hypothetical protein GCM10007875_17020 [Limnobacter litoralis]
MLSRLLLGRLLLGRLLQGWLLQVYMSLALGLPEMTLFRTLALEARATTRGFASHSDMSQVGHVPKLRIPSSRATLNRAA